VCRPQLATDGYVTPSAIFIREGSFPFLERSMRDIVDQNLAGLARELREVGVECDTATKAVLGNEDSSVRVPDPEIFRLLKDAAGGLTLITSDSDLAGYCRVADLPCIRVQDLVLAHIRRSADTAP